MSIRTERVGAEIQKALGGMFQRSLPDYLDGMVTVTSVKMSPDLGIARVYVSFFRSSSTPDILVKRLNAHARELRHELGRLDRTIRLRILPELRFFRDDTLDAVDQINDLLRTAQAEDERLRQLRAERGTEQEEE